MELYIERVQVFFALKYALITPQELLDYLAKVPVDRLTLLAYRHYFLWLPPEQVPNQTLSGGKHFLTVADPGYSVIYALLGYPLVIIGMSEEESQKYFYQGPIRLYTDPEFKEIILCLIGDSDYNSEEEIDLTLAAHQTKDYTFFNLKGLLTYHLIPPAMQILDREPFPLDFWLGHCEKIKGDQPLLWSHLYIEYLPLLRRLFDEKKIKYYPKQHHRFLLLCPDFFPEEYRIFSPLAWHIFHLPTPIAAYYLGFPLNLRQPRDKELVPALIKLSKFGLQEYTEQYIDENKTFHLDRTKIGNHWSFFTNYNPIIVNDRDTLHEDIFTYPCYDLFLYHESQGHFFVFSAVEARILLQGGRNFWTNRPLDPSITTLITHTLTEREIYKLPPPAPISTLLEQLNSLVGERLLAN